MRRALGFALALLLAAASPAPAQVVNASTGLLPTAVLATKATAVDFNSTNTDTTMTIVLPAGYTRWKPVQTQAGGLTIDHCTGTLGTATFGLFTAAGGAGVAIIAAATATTVASTAENTATNMQLQTTTVSNASFNVSQIFFRIGTAQGTAALCDVTVFYQPLP